MKTKLILFLALFLLIACAEDDDQLLSPPLSDPGEVTENTSACATVDAYTYEALTDCTGQTYPDPAESPYVVPFAPGTELKTGLTNCSSSYHSAGNPDQHAYDFDLPEGTPFVAARAGEVVKVVNDQPSNGGGIGNYLVIDHRDATFGLYYHSPREGIGVEVGDAVARGDTLGSVGRSGLAGYPHLHFLVTRGGYDYPYEGVAVSFSNIAPPTSRLKSYTPYTVCPE